MNLMKMKTIVGALLLVAGTAALPAFMSGCGAAPEEESADVDDMALEENDALASSQAPDMNLDTKETDPGVIRYQCGPDESACEARCGAGASNHCFVCCPLSQNCNRDCSSGAACTCEDW